MGGKDSVIMYIDYIFKYFGFFFFFWKEEQIFLVVREERSVMRRILLDGQNNVLSAYRCNPVKKESFMITERGITDRMLLLKEISNGIDSSSWH